MNITRWVVSMVVLAGLLAACGGGGDDGAAAAAIPARAGSADIGPAGGSVDAVLEGGATVQLDVPAGAVAATTRFRIDPADPAGTLGAFALSPADVVLAKPMTLTVTLPAGIALDADTSLLVDAARDYPIGPSVDVASRTIQVDLRVLSPRSGTASTAAATGRSRATKASPAASDPAALRLFLRPLSFDAKLDILQNVVADLQASGSFDNADTVQVVFDAVLSSARGRSNPFVRGVALRWDGVVCGQQQFSVSALNTFAGVDIASFSRLADDVVGWNQRALDLNATVARMVPAQIGCAGVPADIVDPVRTRLPAFLTALTADLDRIDPNDFRPISGVAHTDSPFDLLFKVRAAQVFDLAAHLAFLGAADLKAPTVRVVTGQLDRGRNLAYSTCRSTRDQKLQATLLTVLLVDPLLATAASFDQADMQTDVQFCGMPLRWKVLNAQGTVLQQADAGGIGPGFTTRAANLRLANAARIVLSGPLSALVCPVASQNNEQLTIAAGPLNGPPTQVQTLTPSGTNQYLQSSTLDFDVATLQSQGVQKLVVARQGALCSGEFPGLTAHATIASIVLDANVPVQITATSLPATIAGGAYNASVGVSGGTAPFVWTAAGLPAGLSIDPQTGTLGGSLANPGAFAIALGVTSADGTSAQTTLTLNVVPDVAGTYVGTGTDITPPNETFKATIVIRQSGNLVLLGNFLFEVAPSGGLTHLGNTNGDFVLDPAQPIKITFTGGFIGNRLEYTIVTLSADSLGNHDGGTLRLVKQ